MRTHRTSLQRLLFSVSLVAAFAGFVSALLAAEDQPWKPPSTGNRKSNPLAPTDKNINDGRQLYVANCLTCHGAAGKGDGPAAHDLAAPPSDLSRPALSDQSDGTLFWKISQGRPPMPGFDRLLPDSDRWKVILYLRTLAPKPPAKAPSPSTEKI